MSYVTRAGTSAMDAKQVATLVQAPIQASLQAQSSKVSL